jgi:hypothetical protein
MGLSGISPESPGGILDLSLLQQLPGVGRDPVALPADPAYYVLVRPGQPGDPPVFRVEAKAICQGEPAFGGGEIQAGQILDPPTVGPPSGGNHPLQIHQIKLKPSFFLGSDEKMTQIEVAMKKAPLVHAADQQGQLPHQMPFSKEEGGIKGEKKMPGKVLAQAAGAGKLLGDEERFHFPSPSPLFSEADWVHGGDPQLPDLPDVLPFPPPAGDHLPPVEEFPDLLPQGGAAMAFQEKRPLPFSIYEGKARDGARALLLE